MREHADTQRHQHVTHKMCRCHQPFTGEFLRGMLLGQLRGLSQAADPLGDHDETNQAHDHEHYRLEGVRPSCRAYASEEHIKQDNHTDHQPGQPARNRTRSERLREHPASHPFNVDPRTDQADQEVGNDQTDQNRKHQIAQPFRLETVTKKLNLRHVAILFAEAPHANPHKEETSRVNQPGTGCHQPVSTNPKTKGFAGRPHQRKGGHRRTKDTHQEHKRPDRLAGNKEILA